MSEQSDKIRRDLIRQRASSTKTEKEQQLCLLTTYSLFPQKKEVLPIKQYSNKFFKEWEKESLKEIETPSGPNNKKFNTLLRRKQVHGETFRQKRKTENLADRELGGKNSLMNIRSYSKKKRERAVTEVTKKYVCAENGENSLIELENELIASENFGKRLLTPSVTCFNSRTEALDSKDKKRSEAIFRECMGDKISQSRGLELFSKLFVKEKSAMVERLKEEERKGKKGVSREICS